MNIFINIKTLDEDESVFKKLKILFEINNI